MNEEDKQHVQSETEASALPQVSETPKQHDDQYPRGIQLVIVMTSLLLGISLMALDATIISVATPKISTEFRALNDVGWYGAAYSMLLTAATPISSSFYKYFNPKYVYLVFIAVFEVGSVICATAPTSRAFITGRAVAGLGAAGLLQGAFGMLTYVCSLEKRPLFLGGVVGLFGFFASVGPVIGGALTEETTWRWCFWINLPVGAIVAILIVIFLRIVVMDQSTRQLPVLKKMKGLDFPGVILLMASVSCLFLALQEGSEGEGWKASRPIGLFIGFGLLFIVFGLWQWKAGENATVPLRFMRDRTVVWGSLYLFWDNMASYITIYYMPFFFQAALDQSPIKSGISYISLAVPQMIGLFLGGGITTATGHYMPVILFAQVLCGIGSGLLTTLHVTTRTALWATYMVLTGLGLGLGVNVPHIAIQAVMETDNDIFVANGIASFFGQLGGSLGVPIGNAVLIAALHKYVPEHAPSITANDVVVAGPLGLKSLTTSAMTIYGLREAWALAVSKVNLFLLVVICISVPTACGMKWLNIKTVSRQREEEKKNAKVREGGDVLGEVEHKTYVNRNQG